MEKNLCAPPEGAGTHLPKVLHLPLAPLILDVAKPAAKDSQQPHKLAHETSAAGECAGTSRWLRGRLARLSWSGQHARHLPQAAACLAKAPLARVLPGHSPVAEAQQHAAAAPGLACRVQAEGVFGCTDGLAPLLSTPGRRGCTGAIQLHSCTAAARRHAGSSAWTPCQHPLQRQQQAQPSLIACRARLQHPPKRAGSERLTLQVAALGGAQPFGLLAARLAQPEVEAVVLGGALLR